MDGNTAAGLSGHMRCTLYVALSQSFTCSVSVYYTVICSFSFLLGVCKNDSGVTSILYNFNRHTNALCQSGWPGKETACDRHQREPYHKGQHWSSIWPQTGIINEREQWMVYSLEANSQHGLNLYKPPFTTSTLWQASRCCGVCFWRMAFIAFAFLPLQVRGEIAGLQSHVAQLWLANHMRPLCM